MRSETEIRTTLDELERLANRLMRTGINEKNAGKWATHDTALADRLLKAAKALRWVLADEDATKALPAQKK